MTKTKMEADIESPFTTYTKQHWSEHELPHWMESQRHRRKRLSNPRSRSRPRNLPDRGDRRLRRRQRPWPSSPPFLPFHLPGGRKTHLMSSLYEIESAVEDYIRGHYYPEDFDELAPDDVETDMDELFENTIDGVIEEIADRAQGDLDGMVTDWCNNYQGQIDEEFESQIVTAVESGNYVIEK